MAHHPLSSPADMTQLAPPRLKLAEFVRSPFRAEPPAGTPIEAVLEPEYLGHVAERLRPGDKLEILPECMSYYAEALVVDATKLSARIQLTLGPIPLDAGEQVLASDIFESRWISPAVRFGVVRKSDGALMAKHLPSKADADRWIAHRVGMKAVATGHDQTEPPRKAAKPAKSAKTGRAVGREQGA